MLLSQVHNLSLLHLDLRLEEFVEEVLVLLVGFIEVIIGWLRTSCVALLTLKAG